MNVYQRLSKITSEIDKVQKNMTVGLGNSQYKGVGEVDVLNAVKPLEEKYGIYSYPMQREIVYAETFIGEKAGYKATDPMKTTYKFVVRIKTVYRFVNIDEPKEFVDQEVFSDGEDPMDKAPGKAMTYGDKFALLKAYKIVTGVDTDNEHSNDTTPTNMKTYKKQHSSYGDMNEAQAELAATEKGKTKLISGLEKAENIAYKDTVIKNVLAITGFKTWEDITFKGNLDYIKLTNIIAQELQKEKDIERAGI